MTASMLSFAILELKKLGEKIGGKAIGFQKLWKIYKINKTIEF